LNQGAQLLVDRMKDLRLDEQDGVGRHVPDSLVRIMQPGIVPIMTCRSRRMERQRRCREDQEQIRAGEGITKSGDASSARNRPDRKSSTYYFTLGT